MSNRFTLWLHIFLLIICSNIITGCGESPLEKSNREFDEQRRYAVGGSIEGLEGIGLKLLLNDDATINLASGDTTFTFVSGLTRNSEYAVSISQQPSAPKQFCTLDKEQGILLERSEIINIVLSCGPDVSPVYSPAANWNDYFTYSDTDTVAKCTGEEKGRRHVCLHSAEYYFVDLHSLSNCDGVTVSDGLSLLKWRCNKSDTGIRLSSYGIKLGKGLITAIDYLANPPVWRDNWVSIKKDSTEYAKTPRSQWWHNELLSDSDIEFTNTNPVNFVSLDQTGAIYIVTNTSKNKVISFSNDSIGLLVAPGNTASEAFAQDKKFLWIEGHNVVAGGSRTEAIRFKNVSHSVISNCTVGFITLLHEFYQSGSITFENSDYNTVRGCTISENHRGIMLHSSNYNHLQDIKLYNNIIGIQLQNSSNNLISNVLADGRGYTGSYDRGRPPGDGLFIHSTGQNASMQNIVYNSRFSNSGGVDWGTAGLIYLGI